MRRKRFQTTFGIICSRTKNTGYNSGIPWLLPGLACILLQLSAVKITLRMYRMYVGTAQLQVLKDLPNLVVLDMSRCYFEFLEQKLQLPHGLQNLTLDESADTSKFFAQVEQLPSLLSLNVSGCRLSPFDIRKMTIAFPNLRELQIMSNIEYKITNDELRVFADGLHCLQALFLHNSVINLFPYDGLANLGFLPNLKYLDISGCDVSSRAVPALAKLKQLEYLWIDSENLTNDDVKRLIQQLPVLIEFDDEDTTKILEACEESTSVNEEDCERHSSCCGPSHSSRYAPCHSSCR
jgi:Leucine-rich repeat (LRR) protein